MKIEVTSVSVSKKGTVWIQAKQIAGEGQPVPGEVFDCTYDSTTTTGEKDVAKTSEESPS